MIIREKRHASFGEIIALLPFGFLKNVSKSVRVRAPARPLNCNVLLKKTLLYLELEKRSQRRRRKESRGGRILSIGFCQSRSCRSSSWMEQPGTSASSYLINGARALRVSSLAYMISVSRSDYRGGIVAPRGREDDEA
jgi:hypothetical protein